MDNKNTVWVAAIICLFVYIVVMVYNMAKIDAYNPVVVFGTLAMLVGLTIANVWGDFFTFIRAPPEFLLVSGVGGRLISGPEQLPGGLLKCSVAFNRSAVPKHLRGNGGGGAAAVLGFVLGSVVLDVVGYKHQFKKVDGRDCENPNGAWLFIGRLDGASLHEPDVLSAQADLRVLQDKVGALTATMSVYGQELFMLVNQRHLDEDQMVARLKTIADHMKNVVVISKGAGGGAADAIAEQMG